MKKKVYLIEHYNLPYSDALALQSLLSLINLKEKHDFLILTNHPHVITYGIRENGENLLVTKQQLKNLGIELFEIDRGGKATYHSPGQLISYPIINLLRFNLSIKEYVTLLEDATINTLSNFDCYASRNRKYKIGIWVEDKKIASIGIRVKNSITMHGVALNVSKDIKYFDLIKPCGLDSTLITSLEIIKKEEFNIASIGKIFIQEFSKLFRVDIMPLKDYSPFLLKTNLINSFNS